jgi:hypothetical protein
MKRFLRFTTLACAVFLMSLPLFALGETKPEDLPLDSDEATVTASAEPEMPNIKAHPEYSGIVDIKVDVTSVSMSGINSMLSGLSSIAAFSTASIDKVTMGYSVAMDLGFKFFTGIDLTFGPRLELIGCNAGSFTGNDGAGTSLIYTLNTTAFPFMAGGTYTINFPEAPFEASIGIYGGGLYVRAPASWLETTPTQNYDINYTGGGLGFAAEANISFKYQISESVSAGINGGYRAAYAGSVLVPVNINYGSSALENSSRAFDLGGFLAGINFNMKY